MSILEETKPLESGKKIFFSKSTIIPNTYFSSSCGSSSTVTKLPNNSRKFIILLLSYELNYRPQKMDYYYRSAKKLQQMFHIPGWQLLLPNEKSFSIISLRKKIILSANKFKSDIQKGRIQISHTQAAALNKAYKIFLWE